MRYKVACRPGPCRARKFQAGDNLAFSYRAALFSSGMQKAGLHLGFARGLMFACHPGSRTSASVQRLTTPET